MISMTSLLAASRDVQPDTVATAAAELRLALALRGWVDPMRFMPAGVPEELHSAVLDAVAPDVQTSWKSHPGCWFLRDQERRHRLTTSGADALERAFQARDAADRRDPVRRALALRRRPIPRDLSRLSTEILTALGSTLSWLDAAPPDGGGNSFWAREADRSGVQERLAATLARRRRLADVERMTARPLRGRGEALSGLVEWATGGPGGGGRFLYLSGVGGAGKSTVFAYLEKVLADSPARPLLVHMDCDRPGFDPMDPIALDLALFRQLAVAAPEHAPALMGTVQTLASVTAGTDRDYGGTVRGGRRGGRLRKAEEDEAVQSFVGLEAAVSQKLSQRDSVSFDILSLLGGRSVVLLFDTAELMLARGRAAGPVGAATAATADWIASLRTLMNGADVRVLMAGRNPPQAPEVEAFVGRMREHGWMVGEPVELGALEPPDAAAVLGDLGVADAAAARAAAVLPRTPLILKIAADVYGIGGPVRQEFMEQLDREVIDPQVVRRYLTERIVNHLASPAARSYALAAMVLPRVTVPSLAGVVLPVVDAATGGAAGQGSPRQRGKAVFQGLSDAGWLVRLEPDGRSLTFHPEIRRLGLELMQSDPGLKRLLEDVRRAALAWHRGRRGRPDATFRAYYEAVLGGATAGWRWTDARLGLLGPAVEDLPETILPASPGWTLGVPAARPSNRTWRTYVEGWGVRDGEGERLVRRGRAEEALELYRFEPTRPRGLPPTFVLQALADAGHFRATEVDTEGVTEEIRMEMDRSNGSLPNMLRSRLYWLVRYTLLGRPGPLPDPLHAVLKEAAWRFSGSGPVLLFPAIAAVAEAFAPGRGPIAPDRWFRIRGAIESETRMFLVHHLHFGREAMWWPHLDALFVPQPDWPDVAGGQVGRDPWERFARLAGWFFTERLHVRSVHSLVEFGGVLREMREPVRISIDHRTEPDGAVALLRGMTTEFHRPLRAAVTRCAGASDELRARLIEAADHVLLRLPFRPKELTDGEWRRRVDRDFGAAFGLLIPFVDRARRLPRFCENLRWVAGDDPDGADLALVADSFLAWDRAICRGMTSEWPCPPA
ncbi:hypothetical protein [Azospirillum agricola]|uniref:hypothetical protein n=1 Tax=Azospirillum agricola TaxID=1720247 RepID=UPI000A0F3D34|nr:hypothetical protein [Azospirillum agricola]SMH62590.1 hypothetical protein SAMN02982994_6395 [Azospirillum lipoferum]